MTRETWTYPSGSERGMDGFSGFAGVAKFLSERFDVSVTRQSVWIWYRRRDTTKFPEKQNVPPANGRDMMLFDLDEVERWYQEYKIVSGAQPKG